jgi:hypothetical protein
MINKVIYVGYAPLTEKIIDDFYIDNLSSEGIEVEYWDLSPIFFNFFFEDKLSHKYIFKIKSIAQFEASIKNQNLLNTLFVLNFSLEFKVLTLFKIFTRNNCKISIFARGALPQLSVNVSSFIFKIKKIFIPKLFIGFIKNKYVWVLKLLGIIKPFDIVFSAGKYGLNTIGLASKVESKKSRIIGVNSFDFDSFNKCKYEHNLINGKYLIYLDEYLPFHPDFQMFDIKTIDPIKFYKNLNNLFTTIEKRFDAEVVIAAHPKAEIYRFEKYFDNRKVFFGRTAQLTKDSMGVLFHCSTSVSYAVLNSKPIFTLISKDIKIVMPDYFNFILNFSKHLDTSIINIDESENIDIEMPQINLNKYHKYKYSFLTSVKSENLNSSDIFIQTVLNG